MKEVYYIAFPMKPFLIGLSLCVILFFSLWITPVYAADPTPTPTPKPGAFIVPNGTNNERKTVQESDNMEDIALSPTPVATYHDAEFDTEGEMNMSKFKVFNLQNSLLYKMFTKSVNFLLPATVQDTTKKNENGYKVSGNARVCSTNVQTGEHKEEKSKTKYITKENIDLKDVDETSRQLASIMTKYTLDKTTVNGNTVYDLRRVALEVGDPPPCGSDDTGDLQTPKQVLLETPGLSFTVIHWVIDHIKWFADKATYFVEQPHEVVSKQLTPYSESIACLTSKDCSETSINVDYLKDVDPKGDTAQGEKEKEKVEKSGPLGNTFLPESIDGTKGKTHGEEENFYGSMPVKTRSTYLKADEEMGNSIACAILPGGIQNIYAAGANCQPSAPTGCGSGELPDLSSSGSCGLCNTSALVSSGDYFTQTNKESLPNGDLPELAKKILIAAGSQYNVPPSVLLSMMLNEGSFEHPGDWDWTEENVKEWSVCGGKMPKCDEFAHPATKAKGAFGWLNRYFNDYKEAVLTVDPSRPVDQINECNFMDAAFASAKMISQVSGGIVGGINTCQGYTLLHNRGPAGSCSDWTAERAATARVRYEGGLCNENTRRTANFFKAFSCSN